jgi:putative flavoprotein involved in K+ transport
MQQTDTIVIGAGQAGLAISHELTQRGVDHVVLEKGRIGQSWRNRWDTFCLVTPNWSVQLPGFPYDGDDPNGFMPRDDIVDYLERYAASFGAPVRTETKIENIRAANGSGFVVEADKGAWTAGHLVLATGAYQKPYKPRGADTLPGALPQLELGGYHNEGQLPDGDVLIIGSGQSGCQIAEELHGAGRRVVLACGRAPWGYRRFGGHDAFWWLLKSGFMDVPAAELPPEARLFANVLATGHGGGHDLTLRTLHDMGVELTGHFLGAEGNTAKFADDLAESVAWGDDKYLMLREVFCEAAERLGLEQPALPDPAPFAPEVPTEVDLGSFGAVLFTGGFRPDFTSWLPWPEAFDADGFPIQTDGNSTVVDGLHFVGIHFLRTRKSALLCGVGEDAAVLADAIAAA